VVTLALPQWVTAICSIPVSILVPVELALFNCEC
jgi:hypothetical protein